MLKFECNVSGNQAHRLLKGYFSQNDNSVINDDYPFKGTYNDICTVWCSGAVFFLNKNV